MTAEQIYEAVQKARDNKQVCRFAFVDSPTRLHTITSISMNNGEVWITAPVPAQYIDMWNMKAGDVVVIDDEEPMVLTQTLMPGTGFTSEAEHAHIVSIVERCGAGPALSAIILALRRQIDQSDGVLRRIYEYQASILSGSATMLSHSKRIVEQAIEKEKGNV